MKLSALMRQGDTGSELSRLVNAYADRVEKLELELESLKKANEVLTQQARPVE